MKFHSKIVLGSMRMEPQRQGLNDWLNLLSHAHTLGVDRIHCSDEYDTFPFLLTLLDKVHLSLPLADFKFTVKLAEPHFGQTDFEPERLLRRIDDYRKVLQKDQLDCVQWMWRGNLDDKAGRLRGFCESTNRISEVVEHLKLKGIIKTFHCFPYTVEFAKHALENPMVDGLCIYRNPMEVEYDILLAGASAVGKSILVIRPFKAGEAPAKRGYSELIKFSARLPVVDGIVVSCSSIRHLEECVQAAKSC
jgi:hypothetical protein